MHRTVIFSPCRIQELIEVHFVSSQNTKRDIKKKNEKKRIRSEDIIRRIILKLGLVKSN